jgi:parvulin-like peptidyl-prolyl isomerase
VRDEEFVLPSKDDDVKKDAPKAMDQMAKKPKDAVKEDSAKPVKKAETKPVKAEVKPDKTDKIEGPKVADEPAFAAASDDDYGVPALRPNKARDSRALAVKVAAIAIAVIAIIVGIFGVLVYVYRSENPAVKAVASIIPYPVERVNGHFVTYREYLFELNANKRAYQNNAKLNNQPAVDFNSADGKKLVVQIKQHALDKLVSDSLTAQLASQKKVKVTDKEVNELIDQLYQRYGGKDTLLKTLNQIYGWNIDDLKSVVRKQLLAKNLEEKVTSDPKVTAAAKKKAENLLTNIKGGADFTEIAKKSSQASDAATGGDLGFFTKGQLPDELQKAAEALQPGQVSDPIKDDYGYEILKVVEKKDDGSIHAQHILVKTVDFTEYFQAELKKAKVNKYLKV